MKLTIRMSLRVKLDKSKGVLLLHPIMHLNNIHNDMLFFESLDNAEIFRIHSIPLRGCNYALRVYTPTKKAA
jgi:hypothetical protein